MLKILKAAGLVLVFLYLPQVVLAQVSNLVSLSTPNTENFPVVSSYLEVRNEEGNFVSGLRAEDVTIVENDRRISVDELTELEPGVQFVVAINPGTTFAPRDSQGRSRYDDVVVALADWAIANEGTSRDDLSLMMNGIPDANHLSDPAAWLEALYAVPSDHRNAFSNLQVLSRAISVATDTPPRVGMGRAVLFITPNLGQDALPGLENLGAQARQNGVRLFVWMVAPESYFTTQGALALQKVAFSTGGQFFAYSGTETFPNIEQYLEPLRNIYALTFLSKVVTQGVHTLAVEIDSPELQANSESINFQLDVLPPNPILVSPPADLFRSLITDARTNHMVGHEPEEQSLEILIEFPDGHERPLVRTSLYVNGKIADENIDAPFDRFTWNLSEITESGKYEIQVEAVDDLGMSSISLPHSVNITVQQLPQGFAAEISRQGSIVSAVAVLISGSVLILALVFVMRRRHDPNDTGQWKKRKQSRKNGRKEEITRPNPKFAHPSPRRKLTGWATQFPNRLPWSSDSHTRRTEPYAYLERVYDPNSLEAMTPTQPILIMNNVITLGTDPTKATLILEEPSIAAQHARMRRDREGNFYVLDFGTVAGTWINYSQTSGKEIRIEHGDLIHLGRVGFRFRLSKPPKAYEPVISFEK